ncbi:MULTISPECIES: ubiquinone anaerobic biosynthesis accessory factor UbiT [Nitrospirillum]|uniref:Putative lipid carrier protein YhbT n=1 Tax=Nitrospirillum amazonense TaxID=28077 RepID=A0A560FJA6_9PROT|nr:SCP2 sterol-binding domain-containing protein [Nitrospirillum amazonense]MEC4592336.1 SCP2 sterol-binding domain-containing protein [Nitrospirillum amazonense]TWB21693.1 putative lipid carrier protein YhbT [Nitrospirillum amazonense]
MSLDPTDPPPLSPVLLAGLAARVLPPLPLLGRPLAGPVAARLSQMAFDRLRRRHEAVFQRLAVLGERAFLVDPSDLPVRFLLRPAGVRPGLWPIADGDAPPPAAATLRAPLAALLALLEGRVDGDSLFFSRQLMIEGDMEAVLILRNAVDGADIALERDLAARLPRRVLTMARRWYGDVDGLLHLMARAAHQPVALAVAEVQP